MKSKKRKSVFAVLIKRIFIYLLFLEIITGAYIIIDEIKTANELKEEKAEELTQEVNNMLEWISKNIYNLEKIYGEKQKKILEGLIKINGKDDLSKCNINNVLNQLNIDTTLHGIDIFKKDGFIVNSNIKNLIGNNIFDLIDQNDSTFFYDFIRNGKQFPAQFVYHWASDKFTVLYIYPDYSNEYIVSIYSNSREFDVMEQFFEFRLKELVLENASVVSINFWIHLNNKNIPFINDSHNQLIIDHVFKPGLKTDTALIRINDDGKDLGIKHHYQKTSREIYNYEGVSTSVILDYSTKYESTLVILRERLILLLLTLVAIFLIIYYATRSLKSTLADLLKKTSIIGQGKLSERVNVYGNNEFTTLSEHFNDMVENVETAHIQLKERNEEILAQKDEIETQRDEIEIQRNRAIEQKEIIEKQRTNILDSIQYAQYIQNAVLPEKERFHQLLPESFVYFKPRDIVSGDFYWIEEIDDEVILVAADCTGHGVPGAFMSMLGIGLLNEIIIKEKIKQPSLILNELRQKIKYALKQSGKSNEPQDGMEMTVCSINKKNKKMQFAAAVNPLILIRNNELTELKGDNMPVGVYHKDTNPFTNHEITLEENDAFYMFSDGYPDQFGGRIGRKFMLSNFKKLLLEISNTPTTDQPELLEKAFDKWRQDYKQIDDIIVIGFKTTFQGQK